MAVIEYKYGKPLRATLHLILNDLFPVLTHTTWFNMAVHRLLRGCVRSSPKFRACFLTFRCKVHTKAAQTIEELENVYNERKCFINGKVV